MNSVQQLSRFGASRFAGQIAVAAILTAGSMHSTAVAAVDAYSITDLGVLPGGAFSSGLGINSSGQVTGTSDAQDKDGFGQRGMLAGENGMIDLGLPPVPFVLTSAAPSINDAGDVIVNGSNGAAHAFIWHDGAFTDITTLSNAIYSEGRRINGQGHVVGSVTIQLSASNFPHHGFLYDGVKMIDLNPVLGGDYSDASDIGEDGTIVGSARLGGSMTIHGFAMLNGVVTDLGPSSNITSEAEAINNNGQIAGRAYFDGLHEHPMIYANGQMTDLGLLSPASGGTATAINDAGVVVGYMVIPNNPKRAFIYANGEMKFLTDLISPAGSGWHIQEADDVNSAGQIAATARDAQGHKHAVLLTPISTCPTDINGDDSVGVDDLLAVINSWGSAGGAADVDGNGIVNLDDLLAVVNAWGQCP